MQYGIGVVSWSTSQQAFVKAYNWSENEALYYGDLNQTINILGAAIGALSCSKLLSIGKLRLIYCLNFAM